MPARQARKTALADGVLGHDVARGSALDHVSEENNLVRQGSIWLVNKLGKRCIFFCGCMVNESKPALVEKHGRPLVLTDQGDVLEPAFFANPLRCLQQATPDAPEF